MGVEVWVSLGEEGGWNPHFFGCRGVGLEVDLVGSFIEEILGKMVFSYFENRVYWKENKNGNFTIKSLFVLDVRNSASFQHSIFWNICVSPKVGFFAWLHGARS